MMNIWFDDNMSFDVAERFDWTEIQDKTISHIDLGPLEVNEDGWLTGFGNNNVVDIFSIDSIINT